jgi:hypothetical protein
VAGTEFSGTEWTLQVRTFLLRIRISFADVPPQLTGMGRIRLERDVEHRGGLAATLPHVGVSRENSSVTFACVVVLN